MIGRRFHAQPGVGPEYGAGFVGLLVNIGIPAEDNVLWGFLTLLKLTLPPKVTSVHLSTDSESGELVKRIKGIQITIRVDHPGMKSFRRKLMGDKRKIPVIIGKRPVTAGGLFDCSGWDFCGLQPVNARSSIKRQW
jgi:hypothetical protein